MINLLVWLIVGAMIGWAAGLVLGDRNRVVVNSIVGVVGAIIGGLFFGEPAMNESTLNLNAMFSSLVGAIILTANVHLIRRARLLNASMGQTKEQGVSMDGYVRDIAGIAITNEDFRRVLYTAAHCQLVVMALKPQEAIGAEVHTLDQCLYVAEGAGETVLNGVRTAIRAGSMIVVPAGVHHNVINTGSVPLKLSTIYAPPNHRDGVVHHTRADADADNEHFDGTTTEDAAREPAIHV